MCISLQIRIYWVCGTQGSHHPRGVGIWVLLWYPNVVGSWWKHSLSIWGFSVGEKQLWQKPGCTGSCWWERGWTVRLCAGVGGTVRHGRGVGARIAGLPVHSPASAWQHWVLSAAGGRFRPAVSCLNFSCAKVDRACKGVEPTEHSTLAFYSIHGKGSRPFVLYMITLPPTYRFIFSSFLESQCECSC